MGQVPGMERGFLPLTKLPQKNIQAGCGHSSAGWLPPAAFCSEAGASAQLCSCPGGTILAGVRRTLWQSTLCSGQEGASRERRG